MLVSLAVRLNISVGSLLDILIPPRHLNHVLLLQTPPLHYLKLKVYYLEKKSNPCLESVSGCVVQKIQEILTKPGRRPGVYGL